MVEYLIAIAAELTTLALLIGIGWLVVWWHRKPLLRFFGVSESRRLNVYWSNLVVGVGGSSGFDGQPRSFSGSAIPAAEIALFPLFNQIFNFLVPSLGDQPGLLKKILLSDVRVEGHLSPLSTFDVDRSCSLISVGSGAYNVTSHWIETDLHSMASLGNGPGFVLVPGLQPFNDPLVGFLQRIRIADGPGVAFYGAGPSEQATKAAIYLLASRWDYLYRRFGDRENFCIVLRADEGDHRQHTLLLERGES